MLTKEEAAAQLDGNQYTREGSKELFAAMKEAGLVAVYGGSDDLVYLAGAIDEELGADTIYVTSAGLVKTPCSDHTGRDCPHEEKLLDAAAQIEPHFSREGFTFIYETAIPHATFLIMEDDDHYCRGLVFALADVPDA